MLSKPKFRTIFFTYYIFRAYIFQRTFNFISDYFKMNGRGQYDYLIKLLIIGNSGVGKTCILLQFSEGNFTTSHLTTIGIDFKIKTVDVDGKQIKLQIWDTAGQERFRTITQTYYKNAMGIVLAYDVTDENSYNDISKWMQQIDTHASENVAKILIGNK